MSFDWNEYLALARQLAARQRPTVSDEALWRAAVSRAYYCVYHRALAVAQARDGYRYNRAAALGSHEALIQHYLQYAHPDRQQIASSLEMLRNRRVGADYYNRMPAGSLTRNIVTLTFTMSRATLQALARL